MTMFIDLRPVASASDTVLDQRHRVYTVEGYARRGNEWSDGMRVELEERVRQGVGGGGGNLRPSARLFPPRSHVSPSFVSRSRRPFSHDHLENCETIPPPSFRPPLSLFPAIYTREPCPAAIYFFALPEINGAIIYGTRT